jgi:hypothetical protein
MGKNSVPGLMPNGNIKVESIQKVNDLASLLRHLQSFFKQYKGYSLSYEINGKSVTVTFVYPGGSRKINIIFDGSRPADFLNTTGIIRTYKELLRKSCNVEEEYLITGSQVDLGGLRGYGFCEGTKGTIKDYMVIPGDPEMYAVVETPYGQRLILARLLKGRQ